MANPRAWTIDHSPAFLPGAHTPLDVFPVERIVAAALRDVASQRLGAKQRGAPASGKVGPIGGVATRVGMRDVDACAIDVPIDEPSLLAPTIGTFLHDLRSDREDVGLATLGKERQRRRLHGDVVVHQERPVVANALQSARDRRGKTERHVVMHPLDLRKSSDNAGIGVARRTVGHDNHLARLTDVGKRRVDADQRRSQKIGGVSLGDDDRDARTVVRAARAHTRSARPCRAVGKGNAGEQRREPQSLPPVVNLLRLRSLIDVRIEHSLQTVDDLRSADQQARVYA